MNLPATIAIQRLGRRRILSTGLRTNGLKRLGNGTVGVDSNVDYLERAYIQPDPDYPLPRSDWTPCNDDNQLERWRSINCYEAEWIGEGYVLDGC